MIKKVIAASVATGGLLLAGAGTSVADADAHGNAVGSPGVLSGNQVQVPVHIPVNACGNTVDVVGALNPAFGNKCSNDKPLPHPKAHHRAVVKEHKPEQRHIKTPMHHRAQAAPVVAPKAPARPQLAHTGGAETGMAIAASAGLLVGGTLLFRRGRRAAVRN